jgi:hypothetical protein
MAGILFSSSIIFLSPHFSNFVPTVYFHLFLSLSLSPLLLYHYSFLLFLLFVLFLPLSFTNQNMREWQDCSKCFSLVCTEWVKDLSRHWILKWSDKSLIAVSLFLKTYRHFMFSNSANRMFKMVIVCTNTDHTTWTKFTSGCVFTIFLYNGPCPSVHCSPSLLIMAIS